jgi:hypothetical protein
MSKRVTLSAGTRAWIRARRPGLEEARGTFASEAVASVLASGFPEDGPPAPRAAWNVYLGGYRRATVELSDAEVGPFRLALGDVSADLRLAAWESGTL